MRIVNLFGLGAMSALILVGAAPSGWNQKIEKLGPVRKRRDLLGVTAAG